MSRRKGNSSKDVGKYQPAQHDTKNDLDRLSSYHFQHACKEHSKCSICRDNFRDIKYYLELRAEGKVPPIARFLTYSGELSDATAASIIKDLAEGIKTGYEKLCSEVLAKGDKIMRRWSRFTNTQRTKQLKAALPDGFPNDKWAHLHAFFGRTPQSPVSMRDKYRTKFLLPFLDVESMAKDPSKLLRLIETRRQHPPAEHAWNDHRTTAFGRESGMLGMRLADVMISTQEASYGQSVECEHDSLHRWQIISFPTAEILFEAQCHLYDFLVKLVDGMLKEASDVLRGHEAWTKEAESEFKSYASRGGEDDEGMLYVPIQHFKPLPSFDVDALLEIVRERLETVESESCNLQTDVEIAYDTVVGIVQGNYFLSQDVDDKWAAVACELTQPLLERAQVWYMIETSCVVLEQDYRRQPAASNAEKAQLAKELDTIICHTYSTIYHSFEHHYRRLADGILLTDSAFDTSFKEKGDLTRDKCIERKRSKQKSEVISLRDFQRDRLVWALTEMRNDWGSPYTPGAEVALAYLDDVLAANGNDTQLDAFVNSRAWDITVDFSTSLWSMHHLEIHQPRFVQKTPAERSQVFEDFRLKYNALDHKRRNDGEISYLNPYLNPGSGDDATYRDMNLERHGKLLEAGKLLRRFYTIMKSSPKKKDTLSWLETMRTAKLALNAFWEEVRKARTREFVVHGGFTEDAAEKTKEVKMVALYKDPEALAAIETKLEFVKSKEEAAKKDQGLKRPLAASYEPQREWGKTPESPPKKSKTEEPVKKPKRKNDPTYERPPEEQEQPVPVPAAELDALEAETIEVSQATLSTLGRLWPHQSRTVQEGAVRWNDFQAAMEDIGFVARPTGGSMFSFVNPRSGRSIVMHQPHGSGTVQLQRGRLAIFGTRLARHFGWTYDRFVVRGNEDNEAVE